VPVVTEQYDLVIPRDFWDFPGIQSLLTVIRSPAFTDRVNALGGYDTSHTGQIIDLP